MNAPNLIEVNDVTVHFGGIVANDSVSLSCPAGKITALLGPNGAGKSTLFDVITGARRPRAGQVLYDGVDVTRLPVHRRARMGMARTFQTVVLSPEHSVYDNVLMGAAHSVGYGAVSAALALPPVRRADRRARTIATRAVRLLGLESVAATAVGELPDPELRKVEIARALALGPRLLMLDEPSAGMDHSETMELVGALKLIRDRWNLTILVVEHDIDFVRGLADMAVVLDFGKVISRGTVAQVLDDEAVHTAYLGTARDAS